MIKNLIITPVGESTFFKNWLCENKKFDINLLYYEDNQTTFEQLKSENYNIHKIKGEKWEIIRKYLIDNPSTIDNYDNFWFPDDDLLIDCDSVNNLFELHSNYNLWLSQPASIGYTSHFITKPQDCILRYTSFVEIMCPLMSKETLIKLMNTFNLTKSGWGLDILWPKLLGYPNDKIAIIDNVIVEHTRPVGSNYENRFIKSPMDELYDIMKNHSVGFVFNQYQKLF